MMAARAIPVHVDGQPKFYTFPGKGLDGKARTGFEQRIARALRDYLALRQRNRCWHCGDQMQAVQSKSPKRCTLDHLFDREYGGELSPENCVAACFQCNSERNKSKRQEPRP